MLMMELIGENINGIMSRVGRLIGPKLILMSLIGMETILMLTQSTGEKLHGMS